MPKINVFKDKDGDFVVTTADAVAPGVTAFQINGSQTTAETVVSELSDYPDFILFTQAGKLAADAGEIIASLKHELAHTEDVAEDSKVYVALTA